MFTNIFTVLFDIMNNFGVSDECVQPTVDVIKKCYSGMKIESSCLQEIYNVSTKLVLLLLIMSQYIDIFCFL